jgi:aspartyl-tRNA(Asn)/glutamyl-tRNA(Gln) amidotransferase subunit C
VATPHSISIETVAKVANLARLNLTPQEMATMAEQLSGMLEHFGDIDKLDLSAVVPMAQAVPLKNILREDVVMPSLDRDEVLAAAPDAHDGRFRVPPSAGQES